MKDVEFAFEFGDCPLIPWWYAASKSEEAHSPLPEADPLLDRIDLHIEVPALSYDEIAGSGKSGPASAEVRETVQRVRDVQRARYSRAFACNAHLGAAATREFWILAPGPDTLLQNAIDRLGFSARAYDKVLRVARTLADLEDSDVIRDIHVAEAIQYQNLDRQVL